MRIGVFGLGYVGAVATGCLAELGHEVVGVDVNAQKVESVQRGRAPVIEPGLDDLLARHVAAGRITATTDGPAVAADVDLVVIAVGTPSTETGGVDPRFLQAASRQIAEGLRANDRAFVAVVSCSTSLPAVHAGVMTDLASWSGRTLGDDLGYVCHPEFLRETTAIADFLQPSMIVFGCDSERTAERVRSLYPDLGAPVLEVGVGEAAMLKYAANSWHAAKVTFANEMGELCRRQGIDARYVMDLFCRDDKLNISSKYLRPGTPFGGSCLPKDLRAVLDFARKEAIALPLLQGVLSSNDHQLQALGDRILGLGPGQVAVIGLSFKEGTDDLREAPLVQVVERLIGKGVQVAIYDAKLSIEQLVGSNAAFALSSVPHLADLVSDDLGAVVAGADVVVVNHRLTGQVDWAEVAIGAETFVLDLTGVSQLRSHPRYEGMYWQRSEAAAARPPVMVTE